MPWKYWGKDRFIANAVKAISQTYEKEKREETGERQRKNELKKEKFNKKNVQKSVAEYMNKIDELQEKFDSAKIETELEDIYKKAVNLFDDIKNVRIDSMNKKDANEMSDGNIIFKSLRRNEYISKLLKIRDESYNKSNSLS